MILTIELTKEQESAALEAAKLAGYEDETPERYLLDRIGSVLDDYIKQILTREATAVMGRYLMATAPEREAVVACLPAPPPRDPPLEPPSVEAVFLPKR